jgi:hypothetical protein
MKINGIEHTDIKMRDMVKTKVDKPVASVTTPVKPVVATPAPASGTVIKNKLFTPTTVAI